MNRTCNLPTGNCFSEEELAKKSISDLAACILVVNDDRDDQDSERRLQSKETIRTILGIIKQERAKMPGFLTIPDTKQVEMIMGIFVERGLISTTNNEEIQRIQKILEKHLRLGLSDLFDHIFKEKLLTS